MQDAPTQTTFQNYGQPFQEKIIQALLVDKKWAEQIKDILNIKFFDKNYLSYIARNYFDYYEKYRTFPTTLTLMTYLRDDLKDEKNSLLKTQIVSFFTKIKSNPDLNDLPYVKDKTLDFCRRQALKEALEKSVDLIESEKYESIVGIIKNAIHIGTDNSVGIKLNEDETRFEKLNRNPIPTGFTEFDKREVLDGGLSGGEIGVCLAPTGVGKCVDGNSYIIIEYEKISIDGIEYDPWDEVLTKRGKIFAKNIKKEDELF